MSYWNTYLHLVYAALLGGMYVGFLSLTPVSMVISINNSKFINLAVLWDGLVWGRGEA